MKGDIVTSEVRSIENYQTKEVEVKGLLGISQGENVPIDYPVKIYERGYWGKSQTSEKMKEVKQRLITQANEKGYKLKPSQIKMIKFWVRGI